MEVVGLTNLILTTVGGLSLVLFWEVRKLIRSKQEIEREKKKILKEFLTYKRRNSGVPDLLPCSSCGRKVKKEGAVICLRFDSKGEVKSVSLLCPACLKKAECDRVIPADRYAGRLERFFKEVVSPYPYSDKACIEAVRVMRGLGDITN